MNLVMLGEDTTYGGATPFQWVGTIADTVLNGLGLVKNPTTSSVTATAPKSFMDEYGTYVLVGGAVVGAVVLLAVLKKRKRSRR
jgi:hypothetical protein